MQLVTAFETYGDLHSGWRPQATVAQHLCTGSDDLEVPPLISSQVRLCSAPRPPPLLHLLPVLASWLALPADCKRHSDEAITCTLRMHCRRRGGGA